MRADAARARGRRPTRCATSTSRSTIDRAKRTATFTVKAPTGAQPADVAAIEAAGAAWWPLAMARQLDDAILNLRTNELEHRHLAPEDRRRRRSRAGRRRDACWRTRTTGWCSETIGLLRRTLARLDVSSRSLFALIEPGSCFAGTLAELAFAADRTYMLALPDDADKRAEAARSTNSTSASSRWSTTRRRLQRRFYEESRAAGRRARGRSASALDADAALALGLVTAAPDDIDWDDEIRIAIEERAAMSPDALTGLEANLRFAGKENMATRIFGRLTAWQNWIFNRPNAVGEKGALKVYGTGEKAGFDFERASEHRTARKEHR